MIKIKKRWIAVFLLLLVPLPLIWRIVNLLNSGEQLNWWAELWAPFAFMAVGLVTCADLFLKEEKPS